MCVCVHLHICVQTNFTLHVCLSTEEVKEHMGFIFLFHYFFPFFFSVHPHLVFLSSFFFSSRECQAGVCFLSVVLWTFVCLCVSYKVIFVEC